MERDMTVGTPWKIILNFTIPIVIGNIFQQFYSMVDTVIVGKFVGTKALAAVGSTGTIGFLILGFLMGLTAGFTVLTSQRFGAGDMPGMRKTVGSAAVLSVIVSVVMTVISMAFMKPLLILMNTPEDIFQDAYKYIMIICAGIFTQVMYNLLAGILRALGNSKTPLYFLLFSAALNIVLDLVLIIVFHLGAAGAAYATVIAQGVSALLCLIYIIKKVPILKLDRWDFKLDGHLVRQQLAIGFPMALQYSITAIGAMMVQAALNVLGSVHVAAFTAANKIEQVVTQVYVALGTTMATYCAQNMGAGKVKRISRGFRATTIKERLMYMDGKLVWSAAMGSSGGTSAKAPDTVDYLVVKPVSSSYPSATNNGQTSPGATEVRVARGCSAAINASQYNKNGNNHYYSTNYVAVTFTSDGTVRLSYPSDSLSSCISVEGYQYL